MLVSVAVLAFLRVALGSPLGSSQHNKTLNNPYGIVGGSPAAISDFPWQVSLQQNNFHICGGSLISPQWIVTAAHCVRSYTTNLHVRAGSSLCYSGGQTAAVDQIIRHPNYFFLTANNDIALLHLRTPLNFDNDVNAVELPNQGSDVNQGTVITVTGWGDTYEGSEQGSDKLLKVDVPIVARDRCSLAYPTGVRRINENMICAGLMGVGGADACQGDSGGPAVVGKTLVGVVSWGSGCARPEYPGIYARTGQYRDWIRQTTGV